MSNCDCTDERDGSILGTIYCEADQFATCTTVGGKIQGRCAGLPGPTEEIASFILNTNTAGPSRFLQWLASEIGLDPEYVRVVSEGRQELNIQASGESETSILNALVAAENPGEFILLGRSMGESTGEAIVRVQLPASLVDYLRTGRSSGGFRTFGL